MSDTTTTDAEKCPKCGEEDSGPRNSTFRLWGCGSVLALTDVPYIQKKDVFTQSDTCRIAELTTHRDALLAACQAAQPIVSDRASGGRMLTSREEASAVFELLRSAIAAVTTEQREGR